MAASSRRELTESNLTLFPTPPSDDNTQTSRFSITGWFRKGKDSQAAAAPKSGEKHGDRRPKDLPIRKSVLEHKQEEEDLEAEREEPVSTDRRPSDGRLRPEGHSRDDGKLSLPQRSECIRYRSSASLQKDSYIHIASEVIVCPITFTNGLLPRSLSPLVTSGSRRDSEQSLTKSRGFEGSASGPVVNYTRSLTTVLKHLSSLIERKGQDPTTYSDSSLRQYWMPDSQCKECYDCGEKFTTFRRRHHCRVCGQIFCRRCCNQEVSGKFIGFIGNLRVCTYCCKVVLSYAQSAYTGDFKALQEDLMNVTEATTPSTEDGVMTPRKKFLGFMDEDMRRTSRAMSVGSVDVPSSSNLFEVFPGLTNSTDSQVSTVENKKLLNSAQLRDLWVLIKNPNNGIMFQNHRYRLRTYTDCIIGSELVDWLIQKDKAAQRVQAVAIGKALLDAKWIKCVTSSYEEGFVDGYALYTQGELAESQNLPTSLGNEEENLAYGEFMEPVWFREIRQDDDLNSEDDLLVRFKYDSTLKKNPDPPEKPPIWTINRKSMSEAVIISLPDSLSSMDLPTEEQDGEVSSRQKYNSSPIPTFKLELDTGTHDAGQKEGSAGGPWEVINHEIISVPNTIDCTLTDSFGGTSQISQPSPGLSQSIPWSYEMLEPGLVCHDKTGDLVLETIRNEANRILVAFLDQQLQHEGLDPSWGEKILPLAKKICSMVKPNVAAGDAMDIRYYVHIKRVPGGTRSECCLVKGVICTKNVAHKKMLQKQNNPSILILQAAIEHQRVQNKLASLEPLVLQEHEYLKNCVSKIVALKPTVLVVEKSVARLAQEFLRACGITLVLSVKPRVVARISRQTESSSTSTIDQVSAAKLGTCHNFYLQKYTLPGGFTKTLMFFDGCPGHLGCSVLLRGGSLPELSKVKRVLNLMVYAVFHSRLETAYLKDEFAKPPLTPSPSGSPPNSPPSPMGQTPGKQAIKDTGTIHEVIKAVRIEQAMIRKPPQGADGNAGEKEKSNVAMATPPLSRSRFRATVQKLLMGKGSEGSDHSVSSSAAGSRRGSDGNESKERTGAAGVAGKESDKEMLTGATKLPHANSSPSFDVSSESGSSKKVAKGTETQGKHDDDAVEGILRRGTDSSSSISTSENGLLQEYVLVDESEDANSQTDGELKEIKGKDYEVHKLTGKEEEESVFSFDVTGSDSEVEEAMESAGGIDPSRPSIEDSTSEKEDKERFSRAFNNTILTISPFLAFSEPYFETEEGRHSPSRHFFPRNVFWSPKLQENPGDVSQAVEAPLEDEDHIDDVVYWSTDRCTHKISSMTTVQPHPFTFLQLTEDFWSESTRTLLADFRARGGRYIATDQAGCANTPAQKALMGPHEHKPHHQQNTNQQYLIARKGNEDTQEYQSQHPIYDCLDPYHHQKILLQFSSYSHHSGNMPGHCIPPRIVTMEFYGYNDITLGMFLDRYCFSANYLCPSETCDTLMANHVRRFVHGNASIQVLQRQLDSPVPGYKNKVLMWSWCRKCKQVTPVQPMSRDTWHVSFAKYLEIHFYGKDYGRHSSSSPCCHSLHHHHYQYFGQHNMVASFKFSPIILREIAFPPLPITVEQPFRAHKQYLEESKALAIRGNQVFRGISGNISSLTIGKPSQHLEQKELEFTSQYETDFNRYKQHMDEVEAKVTQVEKWKASPDKKRDSSGNDWSDFCLEDQLLDIEDSIVIAKRCLAEINFSWNTRFHDFLQHEKDLEKTRKREGTSLSRKPSADIDTPTPTKLESKPAFPFGLTPPLTPMLTLEQSSPVFLSLPQQESSISRPGGLAPTHVKRLETLHERGSEGRQREDSDVSMLGDLSLTYDTSARYFDYGISPGLVAGLEYRPSDPMDSSIQPTTDIPDPSPRGSVNFMQGSPQTGLSLGPVPGLVQAVDANKKGDLEKSCETVNSSGKQAAQGFIIGEESKDEEKDGGTDESEKGIPISSAEEPTTTVASLTQSLDMTDGWSPAKTKPGAVKGFLNQFLQHTESTQIETPFPADEHHTLPPCSVIPIIVYDKEPSSIIAYALSSEQYKTKLYEVQQSRCGSGRLTPGGTSVGSAQGNSNPESGQSSPHTRRKAGGDGRMGGAGGPETKDLSRKIGQLKRRISQGVMMFSQRTKASSVGGANQGATKEEGPFITIDSEDYDAQDRLNSDDRLDDLSLPHIELQFSDETNTQFFCGVYFAAQFQELRKVIFPVGEDIFIRSLSRCMQWVARGGKSGSKFMKTMDDRLILKQMSKSEAHSFLNFAPNYFQYMQKAHENNKPTALAKILGFYKVGFQNPVTNTAQKLDLLVQENLFYKRRIAQVFDLKGSIRNRHVKTSGVQTQDLVLLDENLLKHIIDSPLYIRMHSKTALAMAIKADTEFLSSHLVMDYSLLVGLDENTKELVIGIIDFIRTFTWDKKLETFVKSTSGKMPTVVSPELYRSRFLEAMDKYFLLVPDRWTGLGQDTHGNS